MSIKFDDPSRTADYGHFPWELDSEPEEVSRDEAVMAIFHAIHFKKEAYGKTANELKELLIDALLSDEKATESMLWLCNCLEPVEKACHEIANDL